MKKIVKLLLVSALGCFIFIMGYYALTVVVARWHTPGIIQQLRQSEPDRLRLDDLSPWQINALLAVEDPKFYQHHGIDLKTPGAGLTTITQGLAKKIYFHPFKPGIRKIKLLLLAWLALDPLVSKNDQLMLFINHIYLGTVNRKPVIGFAAAADVYYHKTFSQLTEYEYLSLVAMIIAPQSFHLLNHPLANAERTHRLQKVVSGEYQPKNLMDLYYGPLDKEIQRGLAPASYFPAIYHQESEK